LPTTVEWPTRELELLARLLAGQSPGNTSGLTPMSASEVRAAWEELAAKHPHAFAASAAQARTWLVCQAEDCEANGHWAAALFHLDRLLAAAPEDLGWRRRRARALLYAGRHGEAIADWTRVLEHQPQDVGLLLQRQAAYARQGQWDRALADALRATQLQPDNGPAWLLVSRARSHLGEEAAAADAYARAEQLSKAVELAPRTLWNGRPRWPALDEASGWEEVVAELNAGPAAAAAETRRYVGLADLALGQWERATQEFGRALELQPADWQARRGRGRALAELGQWDLAVADWTELLRAKPDVWDAWYLRGYFHAEVRDRPDLALADWARVLEEKKDAAEVRFERAQVAAKMGQWREAAAEMDRVAQTGSGGFTLRYLHALCSLAANQPDAYRQACAGLQNGLSRARTEEVNDIAWACTLAPNALADYEPCLAALTKALTAKPGEYQYLNTLGALLCRAGRAEEAARRLQESIQAHGAGGTAWDWLFLALAQHGLGQATAARQTLERARAWIAKAEQGQIEDRYCPMPLSWQSALELRLLRQEVEDCLGPPTARPPAR
jgi:tetratricopeptide (TPR) repeat protein